MKLFEKDIMIQGMKLKCVMTRYHNPDNTCLVLKDDDGCICATCTINIEEVLPSNVVIIKDYSENEGILNILVENGVVHTTGFTIGTGFVCSPVCIVNMHKFK